MIRTHLTQERNKKLNRSGTRQCDICKIRTILVEHHIRGRDILKPNHPSNISNVCPNCHMKIHSGHIVIEKWIMSTFGKMLSWHVNGEQGLTGDDSFPYQIGKTNVC